VVEPGDHEKSVRKETIPQPALAGIRKRCSQSHLANLLAGFAKRVVSREHTSSQRFGFHRKLESAKFTANRPALGMSDGRRDRSLREAHEVRIHVLAMLTRESGPSRLGRATSEAPSSISSNFPASDGNSDPNLQIEAFIEQASQIR
jgi:hypothetical protein